MEERIRFVLEDTESWKKEMNPCLDLEQTLQEKRTNCV
jgi:hypothetical protein